MLELRRAKMKDRMRWRSGSTLDMSKSRRRPSELNGLPTHFLAFDKRHEISTALIHF